MIGKEVKHNAPIINDFSIPANQTIVSILNFIKNKAPLFAKSFKATKSNICYEDDITQELLSFFSDHARKENFLFRFHEKKGIDITIHVSPYQVASKPIFMIEAKRLEKAHYDYVNNPNGGIERLKREQDGFDHALNHAAILGYIQDHDRNYWLSKINKWIDLNIQKETDIVWSEQDKLVSNLPQSDYISKHERVAKEDIAIYHFWINLN
ncbi:hypothetical protein [Carboxylicivirga sp. M1479]|uniref:hypothetical protein n=1 Tax=Carboxylicivirga sp. M1479 TaxID=2594476 RepID=UPI00117821F7|nr:hypothetical protein [Carboxylicivirga sp. M1479]TRX71716.1 hypothetical protein FNN09_05615 [Carboxylicivirga sp. M1479]